MEGDDFVIEALVVFVVPYRPRHKSSYCQSDVLHMFGPTSSNEGEKLINGDKVDDIIK